MTKPIFDASKTGLPLLRSFLSGLYGRDRLNRVWLAGFRDIQDPSWYGCRGVDALVRRIGEAQLDHADLFFCIGILSDGAKGRTLGEVVDQPVLIADDIGTKADRALWDALFAMGLPEPTFRIETSPGNETWGWKIAGDTTTPEHGEGMALIRAYMVERKLTDNVMDATRYVRLPWGYNSKPKYRADTGTPLASSPQVRLTGGTGQAVELEDIGTDHRPRRGQLAAGGHAGREHDQRAAERAARVQPDPLRDHGGPVGPARGRDRAPAAAVHPVRHHRRPVPQHGPALRPARNGVRLPGRRAVPLPARQLRRDTDAAIRGHDGRAV